MIIRYSFLIIFCFSLVPVISGSYAIAAEEVISGTAFYRERIMLRPGSTFDAYLEDVSRADAVAIVIGQIRIEDLTGPPIAFEIPYDPQQIDERFTYSVRARITQGDKLLMTTDRVYPVLTRGNGKQVELLLVSTAEQKNAPYDDANSINSDTVIFELTGTRWALIQLHNESVVGKGSREAFILFEPESNRIIGYGGCNKFVGEYQAENVSLRIDKVAITSKACFDEGSMEIEAAFKPILTKVRSYRLRGRQLELLDEDDDVIAGFEERNLQ